MARDVRDGQKFELHQQMWLTQLTLPVVSPATDTPDVDFIVHARGPELQQLIL